MDSVVTAFTHYNATKYVQTAATMWVGWDCILTFDREVVFFWQTKWTFLKILFIVNRYLPLLGAAWNTSVLLQPELTDRYCNIGLRIMGQVLAIVSVAVFHAMLIVIINAMYKDSRLVRYRKSAIRVAHVHIHPKGQIYLGGLDNSNSLRNCCVCTCGEEIVVLYLGNSIPPSFIPNATLKSHATRLVGLYSLYHSCVHGNGRRVCTFPADTPACRTRFIALLDINFRHKNDA